MRNQDVKKEWLEKQITVAEAEAAHMVNHDHLGPTPIPFGFENERWQELLSIMKDSDELWDFCSDSESWKHKFGRQGIALVRKGRVIANVCTMMN